MTRVRALDGFVPALGQSSDAPSGVYSELVVVGNSKYFDLVVLDFVSKPCAMVEFVLGVVEPPRRSWIEISGCEVEQYVAGDSAGETLDVLSEYPTVSSYRQLKCQVGSCDLGSYDLGLNWDPLDWRNSFGNLAFGRMVAGSSFVEFEVGQHGAWNVSPDGLVATDAGMMGVGGCFVVGAAVEA